MLFDNIPAPVLEFSSYKWSEEDRCFYFYDGEELEVGRYYPDELDMIAMSTLEDE
jgi:hypothetical protein